MPKKYEDLTRKEAKEHVDGGGTFSLPPEHAFMAAQGVVCVNIAGPTFATGRYVLVSEFENGAANAIGASSFASLEQQMEAMGPVEEWVVDDKPGPAPVEATLDASA